VAAVATRGVFQCLAFPAQPMDHMVSVSETLVDIKFEVLITSSAGNLLKGPIDANGKLKDAALMVGIKLDLEAEIHLTARVRGDILIGLY